MHFKEKLGQIEIKIFLLMKTGFISVEVVAVVLTQLQCMFLHSYTGWGHNLLELRINK